MLQHRYLFLDDGGVLNSNALRQPQWKRLVGEYLSPRLGGSPDDWAEANSTTIGGVFQRQQERLAGWHEGRSYIAELVLTDIDWLTSMCEKVGIPTPPSSQVATLSREANDWIRSRVIAGFPGVADTVRELAATYSLNVSSGGASYELSQYLRTLDIDESIFGRLYGADLVNWPKLGPEYYRRIFANAGVAGASCSVVDDHAECLEWAREAGAFTVHIDSGNARPSVADLTIGSLAELPDILREIDA